MKKAVKNIIQFVFCLATIYFEANLNAQVSPKVLPLYQMTQNNISISDIGSLSLNFSTPTIAGMPINTVSDNSKWLNYTTVVNPPDPQYKIYIEIGSGILSDGLQLKVQAGPYVGPGGENPGTPTGLLTLTNFPQIIINNIGTCETGSGIYVGHQLTYTLIVNDYVSLRESYNTINLVYTISQ